MIPVGALVDQKRVFQSIDSAQFVREGTVADLLLENGRVVRAVWKYRENVCMWWPAAGQRYKTGIPLYTPRGWRIVAHGIGK